MEDLEKQVLHLQEQSAALEPNQEQRNKLLGELQQYANTFLNKLPTARAYRQGKPNEAAFSLDGTSTLEELLRLYDSEVASRGIRAASEGHLGYIPGGGIYGAALADYLAAITNEYSGIAFASPGAVAMEHALLNWMKSLFGFPATAVGNLTSGGSVANLVALTAARDNHGIKGADIARSVVYLSPQVHHCIFKALRIIGLEDVIVRTLVLDEHSRIVPGDLLEQIQKDKNKGLTPFLLVASAGTTDTGAMDPLQDLGKITSDHKMWYHVDAAYGGFFILSPQKKDLFKGIETADSLVVDPHKGLFLPFGLGAVLVKERAAVYSSHHHRAAYMQDAVIDISDPDPADVSPELTKHFRALRLWLPLKLHGISPFIACLEEKLLLTRFARERLAELGFELGPEPDLSVSYFWWPLPDGDQNEFNRQLLQEVHRDGRVFLSSTTLDGQFVIRLALLSFRTKLATIEKTLDMLDELRQKISSRF